MADDLDPLELHLLEQLGPLEAGPPRPSAPSSRRSGARRSRAASATSPPASSQQTGRSFYTIGSAGHESNACVALALRPTDPALLHYRSGALLSRARGAGGTRRRARHPARRHRRAHRADRGRPAQGVRPRRAGGDPADLDDRVASPARVRRRVRDRAREEARRRVPVAGRRGRRLQLRRRVAEPRDGAGRAEQRGAHRLPAACRCRCSSSARTTASGSASRRRRAGSSRRCARARSCATSTPTAPTRRRCSRRRASSSTGSASTAAPPCCTCAPCASSATRAPTSSPPTGRRRRFAPTGRATRCSPPGAWLAASAGWSGERLVRDYTDTGERVRALADEAARIPQLDSAAEIVRPLAPRTAPKRARWPAATRRRAADARAGDQRRARRCARSRSRGAALRRGRRGQGRRLRRHARPAAALRRRARLRHAARRDVDPRARARRRRSAGSCRCRRSSTSPICTTRRTSCAARRRRCSSSRSGQYRNGMVVRIAGYGYQKGFGGHFHNDNAVGVLRDIPGLVIASPARPDDASAMLRDVPGDGARRRQRVRLPRADRALPHARPVRRRRRAVARAAVVRRMSRSARRAPTATATT